MNLLQKLNNKYGPIYPKVRIETWGRETGITTQIRLEHKGKWYLTRVTDIVSTAGSMDKDHLYYRFHSSVYYMQVLGEVNPDIVIPKNELMGTPEQKVFELDEDQRSEIDRLKEMLS